jgi:hypothetical protein
VALSVVAVLCASVASACGDDGKSGDEKALERAVRDSIEAFNNGDFDTWAAGATDAGLRSVFPFTDGSPESIRSAFDSTAGTHYDIVSIQDIVIDGDRGAVTTASAFSFEGSDPDVHIINASRGHYVKVDGAWKFDSYQNATVAVPDGVREVSVTADEFAWTFDETQLADGDIAMQVENEGDQAHQIDLRRIPDDLDLEAWAAGSEFSLEEVPIGSTLQFEPGESRVVVFTAPLKPGRYVMSCFVADADAADGSTHFERGMYREFRVGD